MFRESWITLRLLIDLLLTGIADTTQELTWVQGQNRSEIQVYFAGLKRMALIAILFPIPILILGILVQLNWLIAITGLLWVIATIILLILTAPIAILVEWLQKDSNGKSSNGKKYTNIVFAILLGELVFTTFIYLVPIHNNPSLIPILIVMAAILGIISAMGITSNIFTKKLITIIASILFLVFTASFFFPNLSRYTAIKAGKIDPEVTKLLACMEEENRNKPECQSKNHPQPTAQTQKETTAKEEERFYTAPSDRWSDNINIPPHYAFRIIDGGKILIRSWNGKIIKPGENVWVGDNIMNANFEVRSITGKEEIATVLLRPIK